MDHEAVLSFEYDDDQQARRVARSVRPEIGEIGGQRTTATLRQDAATVVVGITAADLVALRAGCNTWATLVAVAEQTAGTVP
ncbi:KEOPS complex subunit Pcc1 [Halomicrobium katesii]|uniref:KEOPS complex subunit Pcc1 n=1 Tax=Halomicrobium katesii TaxID=437163 RepID=UPI0003674C1D|nr:KEOPS complex subunit Pcc1 [Halomicrobium katesii]